MSHKLRLTGEALRQIETIGDYIAKDSPDNARRWRIRIRHRIETLSNSPERHGARRPLGPTEIEGIE